MDKKKLSIKDISRLSGVSVATVSRVIHKNGRFSAETEKRVMKVIDSEQYAPDIIAQTMRTKVMPIIGVLLTDILNERYALFARAAQDVLNEAGYQMIIFNTKRNAEAAQNFIKMMRSQHAAGYLVFSECGAIPPEYLDNENVVYVWNEPLVKPSHPYSIARFDYYNGAMMAAEHLFAQGCRKVAILRGNDEFTSQREMYRGYLDAHKKHNIRVHEDLAINLNNRRTMESIKYMNNYLGDGIPPFDSVLCCSYHLAIVIMSVFESRRIRMPEDVRMVGFSDIRMSRYGLLKYTAIAEDEEQLGREAVDMLLKQITQADKKAKELILPVKLLKGYTT